MVDKRETNKHIKAEWEAWRGVVMEFELLTGIAFNDMKVTPLVDAIKKWGVLYHILMVHEDKGA
jgi:hypothetical protein